MTTSHSGVSGGPMGGGNGGPIGGGGSKQFGTDQVAKQPLRLSRLQKQQMVRMQEASRLHRQQRV